jgi:hypothetical protein
MYTISIERYPVLGNETDTHKGKADKLSPSYTLSGIKMTDIPGDRWGDREAGMDDQHNGRSSAL